MIPLRPEAVPFLSEFCAVVVGLVLLIGCTNATGMMLARAARRRREIAIRLALGASRFRLIRQLLAESMLIAAGAGVLGLLLTLWYVRTVSPLRVPLPMPVTYEMGIDARTLVFTMGVTVFTGLAFGLFPALQATRTDITAPLKEGGNVFFRRRRQLNARNLLLLFQVAASLTLLLIVALLSLGIQNTMGFQAGFKPEDLYLISLDPVRDGYSGEQAAKLFTNLAQRVGRLPSVTSASVTDNERRRGVAHILHSGGGRGPFPHHAGGTEVRRGKGIL
jgi:cell division protein FtsX